MARVNEAWAKPVERAYDDMIQHRDQMFTYSQNISDTAQTVVDILDTAQEDTGELEEVVETYLPKIEEHLITAQETVMHVEKKKGMANSRTNYVNSLVDGNNLAGLRMREFQPRRYDEVQKEVNRHHDVIRGYAATVHACYDGIEHIAENFDAHLIGQFKF